MMTNAQFSSIVTHAFVMHQHSLNGGGADEGGERVVEAGCQCGGRVGK